MVKLHSPATLLSRKESQLQTEERLCGTQDWSEHLEKRKYLFPAGNRTRIFQLVAWSLCNSAILALLVNNFEIFLGSIKINIGPVASWKTKMADGSNV
jgi:hypothetical protein